MSFARQIWILAIGRLLSAIGSGFTAFYAPIFFVNTVGLKASSIGLGLGAGAVAGMLSRILSGSASDHPRFGRKRTMLLAVVTLACGSFTLASTGNFATFFFGAICMGFGVGLFWPATQAFIADVAEGKELNEAYGLNFVCDYVGVSLGVVLGGLLISMNGNYRLLFVIDGISYLLFFAVVFFGIKEPTRAGHKPSLWQGWEHAAKDSRLKIYVCFNLLFTSYVTQVETTLPLFFKNFVHYQGAAGLPYSWMCGLFAEYIVLMSLIQLPLTSRIGNCRKTRILMAAAAIMGAAFCSVWLTSVCDNPQLVIAAALLAMALFAVALVLYGPAAAALVAEIAPENARGVYVSINSLCWAAGGACGAPLGLSALDLPPMLARHLWLVLAGSAILAVALVFLLEAKIRKRPIETGRSV